MNLNNLGWNTDFQKAFDKLSLTRCVPARLIRDNKITYGALFVDDEGDVCEREVVMSGKVYHDALTDAELPAVGDWVAWSWGWCGVGYGVEGIFILLRPR